MSLRKSSVYQFINLHIYFYPELYIKKTYLNILANEGIIWVSHSLLHILLMMTDLYLEPETSPFI